jgi:hypothetical protein
VHLAAHRRGRLAWERRGDGNAALKALISLSKYILLYKIIWGDAVVSSKELGLINRFKFLHWDGY